MTSKTGKHWKETNPESDVYKREKSKGTKEKREREKRERERDAASVECARVEAIDRVQNREGRMMNAERCACCGKGAQGGGRRRQG